VLSHPAWLSSYHFFDVLQNWPKAVMLFAEDNEQKILTLAVFHVA
jgi:hypothetical protein